MNETELEQFVADRVAAKRDAVEIRPDFNKRIIRALEAARSDTPVLPRRRPVARELVLASALLVFVALLAGGAAWLRSQSQPARHSTPRTSASLAGIRDVHMMTALVGWAVTGPPCGSSCSSTSILRTTDGGDHWTETRGRLDLAWPPGGAFFLDSTHAWYAERVGNWFRIASTVDGGTTWRESKLVPSFRAGYVSLQFVDPKHGWAIDANVGGGPLWDWQGGVIYQTVDGGTSWKQVEITPDGPVLGQPTSGSLPARCFKAVVVFSSRTRGWAPGSCAARWGPDATLVYDSVFFYRTDDGGRTWSPQALPVPSGYPSNWFDNCSCDVGSVRFPDLQDGSIVVTGYVQGSFGRVMFITHDGGRSWESRTVPQVPEFSPPALVEFINGSNGWLVEDGRIYQTDDGARTWTQVYQFATQGSLLALSFVNQSRGWAVTGSSQLLRTSDGGRTWSP